MIIRKYCLKGKVFKSGAKFGLVCDPKDEPKAAFGHRKCIPLSRCVVGDLLSPEGSLRDPGED